ncbi:MAG: 3-isopropylmalate dehydratase small subunit [Pseudomonadota bacterium]|nr:3-isopropylmalate dehydratase small subunit [Pseudomonadota bacterium]
MQKFTSHSGVAAPLLRINIDTDAIIPSREMKRVSRQGLGDSLFADWRYQEGIAQQPNINPDFVLNQPAYLNASILLTGQNMGCGSSREFAVWALTDFGIRAIIAPSFGAIFYTNCIRNGLLPVILDATIVNKIATVVDANPQENKVEINLELSTVMVSENQRYTFEIEASYKQMLLQGLDPIDLTLQQQQAIDEFIASDRVKRPWV